MLIVAEISQDTLVEASGFRERLRGCGRSKQDRAATTRLRLHARSRSGTVVFCSMTPQETSRCCPASNCTWVLRLCEPYRSVPPVVQPAASSFPNLREKLKATGVVYCQLLCAARRIQVRRSHCPSQRSRTFDLLYCLHVPQDSSHANNGARNVVPTGSI